jgi:D-alanyl-D-alanine carboxypeptidase/D-alanyl-D-alanine-endopeptidase (penicillin-binding protein 4)
MASLTAEFDSAFAAAPWARASWGVMIMSLDKGDVLYRRNAEHLFMPASNQKIITGSVALARLGADFRFRTPVLAVGTRSGDTLKGDIVVLGRGDPTLSQHASDNLDMMVSLRPWVDSIRARGIRVITGRVIGDASYYPDPVLGEGWMWDDLQDSYSAPVGALMFNESFAQIVVTPGERAGDAARIQLFPASAPLRVFGAATTAPRDSAINQIRYARVFYGDSVIIGGRISAGLPPEAVDAAVTDPARYLENALAEALRASGVSVLGVSPPPSSAVTPPPFLTYPAAAVPVDTLFRWQSPPLRDILPLLEKPSQNQIAEILLHTLGSLKGVASVDSGKAVVRETLLGWGVPPDAYVYLDGSGLSRYNYVAPEALAAVLTNISRHPDFSAFYNALPIGGVDGTIRSRFTTGLARGNVHAKTGSIANARSLSGYVTTAGGEHLVFVLLCNHFTVRSRVVETVSDFVVERLATMRRRP